MTITPMVDGVPVTIDIVRRKPTLCVAIDGTHHDVIENSGAARGTFNVTIQGRSWQGWRYATAEGVHVRLLGRTYLVALPLVGNSITADSADDVIFAEMPGSVVSLHCSTGEQVESGQALVTTESMKLQVTLLAQRDGMVEEIHYAVNESFNRGDALVTLKPE